MDPLSHSCKVSSLSIFYRYFFHRCFDELVSCILPLLLRPASPISWLVLVLAVGGTSSAIGPELLSLGPVCDGRQTLVHLFEWRWEDIANECETFLAPYGYCAVQISPPQEHRIVDGRPWHQRYQPISYLLESRSGNRSEFEDMVSRCNAVGVRIIVDAVINHMAEQHTEGYGSANSHYVADNYDFPPYNGASYFTDVFMCPSPSGVVTDYQNLNDIRDCRYLGLLDLYTSEVPVQETISLYLNQLLDIGVAGFRIDSASYIWPEDLEFIYAKVNNLSIAAGFPEATRPFIFHDVIAPGTAVKPSDYYNLGGVTETQYGRKAASGVGNFSLLETMYEPSHQMIPPENAVVYTDSHLSQRSSSIPAGEILTYADRITYQMGNAFMLADSYGIVRIMSSYEFSNVNQGPPTTPDNSTLPVNIGVDGLCEGGWVCEHRWAPIANMVNLSLL
ncbi:alpha-amylase [Halocaridina rubra]|uniref:Alpha-amylase n=1 Tax=Halocaridina rubra TaxID=373956 RepID=A0AAN8XIE7_HALRR